jgi:glycogen synthase
MMMGSSQGNSGVKHITVNDVAERVGGLGDVFAPYAAALRQRGVVGSVFAKLTVEELSEDFGVKDKYHLRALLELQKIY